MEDFGKLLAIEPRLAAMFPPREALYQDYVGCSAGRPAAYKTGIYRGKITFFWAQEEPGIARPGGRSPGDKYPRTSRSTACEGRTCPASPTISRAQPKSWVNA